MAAAVSTVTRESLLPVISDMTEMISKDGLDQYRQEEMLELIGIKERLAHDGCHSNLKVLQRALLIPEEDIRVPGSFIYPTPSAGLMVNPFPKKKSKKKGKKGGKKKK
jgi:hypothetical protein